MYDQWGPQGPTHRKVTIQKHTTTFHVVMMLLTGGLWLPVWMLDRRTVTVKETRR